MGEEERQEELKRILGYTPKEPEVEEEFKEEEEVKKESILRRGPAIGRGRWKVRINAGFGILLIGLILFIVFYLIPLYTGEV